MDGTVALKLKKTLILSKVPFMEAFLHTFCEILHERII